MQLVQMKDRRVQGFVSVTGNPTVTHLKVAVYHSKGGLNYATYKEEPKGYWLSVTPVKREVQGDYIKYFEFKNPSICLIGAAVCISESASYIEFELLLSNEVELNKYIENGKAELHWKGKKVSHYNLIEELLNSSYLGEVRNASKFLQEWQQDLISTILASTEIMIPVEWKDYCIPDNRKRLIEKLITLRFYRLNKLINDRVR
jgi:hypothetical protein